MIERLHRLYDVFHGEDKVVIVINADPDAIASAMALKRLLWRKVSSVTIARTNVIKRPDNLALLAYTDLPLVSCNEVKLDDFSRVAMVDSQPHHMVQLAKTHFHAVIDHHPLGEYSSTLADIRPDYGATSTMMTEYLQAAKIHPSRKLATALFYGIKTDTSDFARQGQLEDVRAFRWLFPRISQNMLHKIENAEFTRGSLNYFRKALERVKIRKDTALVFLEKVDNPDTLVMIADFFMKIHDISRVIAAGVFKDSLVVIFRVVKPRVNAGGMAIKALGEFGQAGGHKAMARAEIPVNKLDRKLFMKEGAMERFLFGRLKREVDNPKN